MSTADPQDLHKDRKNSFLGDWYWLYNHHSWFCLLWSISTVIDLYWLIKNTEHLYLLVCQPVSNNMTVLKFQRCIHITEKQLLHMPLLHYVASLPGCSRCSEQIGGGCQKVNICWTLKFVDPSCAEPCGRNKFLLTNAWLKDSFWTTNWPDKTTRD